MEKPKIVSMKDAEVKDAFDLGEGDSDVPELPGELKPPQEPPATLVPAAPTLHDSASFEEHPPEVPPERIASRPIELEAPAAPSEPPSTPSPVTETIPPVASPPASASEPVVTEPSVEKKPPAGAPPWVEREPQTPTVAEAAGPVPVYPGVGRPKIQSIQQGPSLAQPQGKLYERPELESDRFAEDLAAAKDATPTQRDVAREYREAASRDMLPPPAPPRPLTAEEQRAQARSLAGQIHEQNQQAGLFGKVKRFFGLR